MRSARAVQSGASGIAKPVSTNSAFAVYVKSPVNVSQSRSRIRGPDLEPLAVAATARFRRAIVADEDQLAAQIQEPVSREELRPGHDPTLEPELVAGRRRQRLELRVGNDGSGVVAGETFKSWAGLDIVHVPYRSAPPAINDLLAGRVSMMFTDITVGMPHVQAKSLRALATTRAVHLTPLHATQAKTPIRAKSPPRSAAWAQLHR